MRRQWVIAAVGLVVFLAARLAVAQTSAYSYDAEGRLLTVRYDGTRSASFRYDADGYITNMTLAGSMAEEDADADSLPDAWELVWFNALTNTAAADYNQDTVSNLKHYQNGTDPTAPDTDHDGMPNTEELRAGTDPTNALSFLKVSGIQMQGPGVVVHWSSVTNRNYRLQRSTNLLLGFQTNIRTNIPAFPPMNSATDSMAAGSGVRVYRIGVE